jgi:hypothetical protein
MNDNSFFVMSLVYSLPDFFMILSVLIRFQLYSIRHCYWIFATQEKRSATALRDVEQRCSPAGAHLLATTRWRLPAEASLTSPAGMSLISSAGVSLTSPRTPLGKHFP